jgi:hypothetical protein
MAHAQKPDFVFRRNGRVRLNRQGRQFSRLLAAEVCASALVMLDTPCSEVVWRVLDTNSIRQFPLHFPSPCVIVCHHISSGLYISLMQKCRLKGVPFRHLCEGFEENHATSQDSCCPCHDSNPVHPEYKWKELPLKPLCWMTHMCKLWLIITNPTSNKPI